MFWHVSVCLSTGGVPISHNALQHYPECHGAARGGTLPGPAGEGGSTLPGPAGGGGVSWPGGPWPGGVPWPGGLPWLGGTLARGVPWLGGYPGRRGGTQLGQHMEYLLHGGRYASCVHAGGLSCFFLFLFGLLFLWELHSLIKNNLNIIPISEKKWTNNFVSVVMKCHSEMVCIY